MEEYLDTQVSAEQEGVVGSPVDEQGEQHLEGENNQPVAEAGDDAQHEREENNRMAAARRSGAREGYTKAQREADEQIAAFGRVDPRTGKPIRSMADMMSFLKGQEDAEIEAEAAKSKRSTDEIRREREARRIGERQMEEQRQKADQAKFLSDDAADFISVYGRETFDRLMKDEDFADYADGKVGKKHLVDIYHGYQKLSGKAERAGREQRSSKEQRSTGSGSGNAGNAGLKPSERAALEEWNRNFPQYKMTEDEWKKR